MTKKAQDGFAMELKVGSKLSFSCHISHLLEKQCPISLESLKEVHLTRVLSRSALWQDETFMSQHLNSGHIFLLQIHDNRVSDIFRRLQNNSNIFVSEKNNEGYFFLVLSFVTLQSLQVNKLEVCLN